MGIFQKHVELDYMSRMISQYYMPKSYLQVEVPGGVGVGGLGNHLREGIPLNGLHLEIYQSRESQNQPLELSNVKIIDMET